MKHAREDYNRIQDPAGKIPEDEPVFLIRARDTYGPETVREWVTMQINDPDHDPKLIKLVEDHVKLMDAWQATHGCKVPDA